MFLATNITAPPGFPGSSWVLLGPPGSSWLVLGLPDYHHICCYFSSYFIDVAASTIRSTPALLRPLLRSDPHIGQRVAMMNPEPLVDARCNLRPVALSLTAADSNPIQSNLQGGQGHPGRARGTQGKAREGVPRASWGPPGFPLGPPGPPWVPLASLELHQTTLTRGLYGRNSQVTRGNLRTPPRIPFKGTPGAWLLDSL